MKQNTLNDSLEVYHLYYLQIMFFFKIEFCALSSENQEVGQCWQSTHIRLK